MTAPSIKTPRCIGVAADHGSYALKEQMPGMLRDAGYTVVGFGGGQPTADDAYAHFVVHMARAVVRGEIDRGVAICGSAVGACIVANKVPSVRACLIHDTHKRQGTSDKGFSLSDVRSVANEVRWLCDGVRK